MEPEPHKAPVRFYEIDLLRFLASLSVVFYHYTFWGHAVHNVSPLAFPALAPFTKYGYLGVELFFIISGYVVLLSAQGKTVLQFVRSRVTRLYTAFWAACTLTFVVDHVWGFGSGSVIQALGQYAFNLSMLHEFFGMPSLDGSYWSLTVEITFYFLVSLLIAYRLMRHLDLFMAGWLSLSVLSMAATKLGASTVTSPFTTLFFPRHAPLFVAGMLFYLMQAPAGRTRARYGLLVAAYGLALRSGINHAKEMTIAFGEPFSPLAVGGAITLFFGLFLLISFQKISLSRFTWLKWPGALTYPLYLVHQRVGYVLFTKVNGLANKYALLASTVLFMICVAYVLHRWVEKPLSKLLSKWLKQWFTRLNLAERPAQLVG